MSEIELKACPFCGGPADQHNYVVEAVVHCTACCAVIRRVHARDVDTGIDASALAWNIRAPQWQPIESAPKDGTGILLSNGKDVAEGHWYFEEGGTTEYRDLDGRYIDQTDSDGYAGWLDWDGGMQPDPTHWQPLPAAPEVSA